MYARAPIPTVRASERPRLEDDSADSTPLSELVSEFSPPCAVFTFVVQMPEPRSTELGTRITGCPPVL
jgi:hypothetical protein